MSKRVLTPLFVIILLCDLLIGHFMVESRWLTKPLIMAVLLFYYWSAIRHDWKQIDTLFFVALIAAWMGDIALLWEHMFLLGLGCFLVMQILYITCFVRGRNYYGKREWMYGIALVAFECLSMSFLWTQLGDMAIPVLVYSIAISTMSWFAWTRDKLRIGYLPIWVGTVSFIISDMIIAIHQFTDIWLGGMTVMITYGLAQYLIVTGFVDYRKDMLSD